MERRQFLYRVIMRDIVILAPGMGMMIHASVLE
jgi:hypothetical protein